jgi:hypothetical protein
VKPRTKGAVFKYSTIDMRNGCKNSVPQECKFSIAKGAFGPLNALFFGKFAGFKSAGNYPLLRGQHPALCFVILGPSATINTSVFYLLKRRKTHGNEV